MDIIEPILCVASQIYSLVECVKANKKRCRRVAGRVKALDELVRSIQQKEAVRDSADVVKALSELSITLTSAKDLITKYTSAGWMERVLKSSSHGDEFASVNERFNDAFQILSGALQVEQSNVLYQVFELATREKLDEVDGRHDDAELQKMLQDHINDQKEKIDRMLTEFKELKVNVEKVVSELNKPSMTDEVIRMIKHEELKYDYPHKPFMTTSTSEVYKGEYRGFAVAIKRYLDPQSTCAKEVRSVFNKEVETMRRFESPNILRMFGICVQDEEGPNARFLIIMEYCEKGNLREVLDSSCKLSWIKKARMCLDAAQGLYRLHQTEEKSRVHGCISSNKFLVAEGYRVKLGGFELTKTETSLKKHSGSKMCKSLCYYSPQRLSDINHRYSKECEMYSFGIVLWEIATRKNPFEGCSNIEIQEKVCSQYLELLPEDCPEKLAHLIDACRAYDNFHRPTAGVLVDKLRCVVAELEEE